MIRQDLKTMNFLCIHSKFPSLWELSFSLFHPLSYGKALLFKTDFSLASPKKSWANLELWTPRFRPWADTLPSSSGEPLLKQRYLDHKSINQSTGFRIPKTARLKEVITVNQSAKKPVKANRKCQPNPLRKRIKNRRQRCWWHCDVMQANVLFR